MSRRQPLRREQEAQLPRRRLDASLTGRGLLTRAGARRSEERFVDEGWTEREAGTHGAMASRGEAAGRDGVRDGVRKVCALQTTPVTMSAIWAVWAGARLAPGRA